MIATDQDAPRRRLVTPLRLILFALLLPVLAVGVAFAIGTTLPETTEARGSVAIDLAPDDLFAALMDGETHPAGGSMAQRVERLNPDAALPIWREDLGETAVTVTTVEASAPTRIVRELHDPAIPMSGRWELGIEAQGEGSRLTYAITTTVGAGDWKGPLFRVAIAGFGGAERGVQDWITRASGALELDFAPHQP